MQQFNLIPLVAFTLIAVLLMYATLDSLFEKGLSLFHIAGCLLKLAGCGLFLLPVVTLLFNHSVQWAMVEGITGMFLLSILVSLLAEVSSLVQARSRRHSTSWRKKGRRKTSFS
ncbi:MAG: hypothetical protein ABI456_01095 [Ktedonobacteraceae bacterium]|nr:hypothetical protein [Chloroflexota bacterium]